MNTKNFGLSVGALVVALLFLNGCHRKADAMAPPEATQPVTTADKVADQYKNLRTADLSVDDAVQEIDDALEASKALAPKAGGDAKRALSGVADSLDGAGESMGDYVPVADSIEEFKKDFAAQDDRRIRAIKATNDALSKLGDASDILSDLSKNVPPQFKQDLDSIKDNVTQAQSDLSQAVTEMGGHVSDESTAPPASPQSPDKTP